MNFPKVTVALISYNQENFIRAAAESCLSQDYRGSLEIIFSDDFSTDATFDIMTSIADSYRGPHKVVLRRNSKNVGIGMHYNTPESVSKYHKNTNFPIEINHLACM
jgi:glycosyltransferase involved in cell wall biosynthesis